MLVCGSRMQAVTNCSNATKFDRPEAVEEKRKASTNSDQNLELRQCLICTLRALVRCDPISIGCATDALVITLEPRTLVADCTSTMTVHALVSERAGSRSDNLLGLRQCLICTLSALVCCDPISVGCATDALVITVVPRTLVADCTSTMTVHALVSERAGSRSNILGLCQCLICTVR